MAKERRKAGKADAPKARKVTILLSAETDLRLAIVARMRGIDRSSLAEEILARQLRHVVVSIRGEAGESETAA